MTRQEVLGVLEEMLQLAPHTLTGGERLADLEAWDSLSALHFIAVVDKQCGLPLPGSRVARCRTVDELVGLVAEAGSGRAA
jgi:acyl carrier protein